MNKTAYVDARWFDVDELTWFASDVEPLFGELSIRSLCDRLTHGVANGAYGANIVRKLAPRGGRLAETIRERLRAAAADDWDEES